jgi:hypothetical protein
MTAGALFQFVPGGCRDYAVQQAATAFDICSVVNCTGGSYFDFCYPTPLFMDCPNVGAENSQ